MQDENDILSDILKDEEENQTPPEVTAPEPKPAEPEAPKKETRGRKKGSTKEKLKETAPKKETALNDILSEYKDAEQKPEESKSIQENESLKDIVNGYLLLIVCDVVIAGGLLFLLKMFDKSVKEVEFDSVGLTTEQRKKLEPLADKVAISLLGNVSPIGLFTLTLGAMYYVNIQEQKSKLKPKK